MTENGRPPYPHVYQVNVSDGGVPKRPVLEAVIAKTGVEGDRQRNLKVHGGPDRAVCLYSQELIERLQDEGHSIEAGSSGENLTLAGLEWEKLKPGDRLQIGPAVQIEITRSTTRNAEAPSRAAMASVRSSSSDAWVYPSRAAAPS